MKFFRAYKLRAQDQPNDKKENHHTMQSSKNLGARIERAAIMRKLKRMLKSDDDSGYLAAVNELIEWIGPEGTTSRAKRTASKKGGLGRQ
jgi:hypothetical protein